VAREEVPDPVLSIGRDVALGMSAFLILLHGLPHWR
jgi:hypothetical protein